MDLEVGRIYHRRNDLHTRYGGNRQSGISYASRGDTALLFTGLRGQDHGYADRFLDDGTFLYYGEGQTGDMQFTRGNKVILESRDTNRKLLVFKILERGTVQYLGEFAFLKYELDQNNKGRDGKVRTAIVFHLEPVDENYHVEVQHHPTDEEIEIQNQLTEMNERELFDLATHEPLNEKQSLVTYRKRSAAVREFVLRRASGICEGCGEDAPFFRPDKRPYLESHHTTRLADGGPDDPRDVIALCPNCHAEVHYGEHGVSYNESLIETLEELARSIQSSK